MIDSEKMIIEEDKLKIVLNKKRRIDKSSQLSLFDYKPISYRAFMKKCKQESLSEFCKRVGLEEAEGLRLLLNYELIEERWLDTVLEDYRIELNKITWVV